MDYDPYDEPPPRQSRMDDESKKVMERVIVVLSFGVSICYGILLAVPTGWHTKVTQIWSFYIGLFNVTIRMDTLAGGIIKRVWKYADKASWDKIVKEFAPGEHSLQQLRDQVCNLELLTGGGSGFLKACWIWSQMLYGSWAMAIGLANTIVFLLVGAGLLLAPPTKCIRWGGLGMFGIAAICNAGGAGGYVFLTIQMQHWLSEFGFLAHDQITFSVCSAFAGCLTIIVCILPGMVFACTNLPRDADYYDDYQDCYPPVDEYGNPLPVDQYGNPMPPPPMPVDQYGNPLPVDQFGNPVPMDQYGNPMMQDPYGGPPPGPMGPPGGPMGPYGGPPPGPMGPPGGPMGPPPPGPY